MDKIKSDYTKIQRQRSNSGRRKKSPGGTTKCTRDEDINIDEFMKDDMRSINKEEEKL